MVAISRLSSSSALEGAIAEFFSLGREGFRRKYRGGASTRYVVVVDGTIIDSKPLTAAAYNQQFNANITCGDFNGGGQTARALKPLLKRLGHEWKQIAEAREPTEVSLPDDQNPRQSLTLSQVHDVYRSIDSVYDGLLESGNSILLLSSYGEISRLAAWEGWSADGKTCTIILNGRNALDMILRHEDDGRALRVLSRQPTGSGTEPTFVDQGTFVVDLQHRYTKIESDSSESPYLVHLSPRGAKFDPAFVSSAAQPFEPVVKASFVATEEHSVAAFAVPPREGLQADKKEQRLVEAFRELLLSSGHKVGRFRITTQDSLFPLYSDLYDRTTETLYEAKSSASRSALRLGLGQVLDYRRYLDAGTKSALLLPQEPQADMLELLSSYGVSCVWKGVGNTFYQYYENRYSIFWPHDL